MDNLETFKSIEEDTIPKFREMLWKFSCKRASLAKFIFFILLIRPSMWFMMQMYWIATDILGVDAKFTVYGYDGDWLDVKVYIR